MPFLGNIGAGPVGMECQCSRSSHPKSHDACRRSSGVRLARNLAAAPAIADDDRSAAINEPAMVAITQPDARNQRNVDRRVIPHLRRRDSNLTAATTGRTIVGPTKM